MTTRILPPTANLTRAEYEAIPALSYSGMKELARSPAHYKAWLTDKREETKALRIGKAVHCAFLQPDLWAKTYKAIPACDRRTKEGKALYEAFMDSMKDGDTALPFDEYELATEVAQSAERISDAHIIRTGAWAETPLMAYDCKTPIKGIPDLIDGDGGPGHALDQGKHGHRSGRGCEQDSGADTPRQREGSRRLATLGG